MSSAATAIDLRQIDPDLLYPRADAGRLTKRAPKTLANMATEGRGPAITYLGGTPYYRGRDLLEDIERGRVDFAPTTARAARRPRRAA